MMDSLEKKLYQLIINRLNGDRIGNKTYRNYIIDLIRKNIGGFIIFGGQQKKIKDFISELQDIAKIPLFIAADVERGATQQIKGSSFFPSQMAVSAAINNRNSKDISLFKKALENLAFEIKDLGINLPLIPVLDVNQNPDNPIVCTRAFSDNPQRVSWFGCKYIKILEQSGLISCAKHFPGHGDTSIDSHIALPVIHKPLKKMYETDIQPFISAISTGVRSIMIGHLNIAAIDNKPATISWKVVTDLLRNKLGFRGLIISDALNMNALSNIKHLESSCLNAGIDILLHPQDPNLAVKNLLSDIKSNIIDLQTVDSAIKQILKIKSTFTRNNNVKIRRGEAKLYSSLIIEKSITLVNNKKDCLPLKNVDDTYIIFCGDKALFNYKGAKKYFHNIFQLNEVASIKDKNLVFIIFTSISAWKGTVGIEVKEKDKIIRFISQSKNSILISLGNPYILKHFKRANMLIVGYDTNRQTLETVLKKLKSISNFSGRLPIRFKE